MKPNTKRLLTGYLLPTVIVGVVFFFIARNIVRHWNDLVAYGITLNPVPLLLSFPFFAGAWISLVQGWRSLVRHFGFGIPLGNASRIILQSSLGRYAPGKVWAGASLLYLGRKWKIPLREGLVCGILSTSLVVIAGAAFSAPWMLSQLGLGGSGMLLRLSIVTVATLVVLHPRILLGSLNFALRRIKKEPIRTTYGYAALCKSFPFYLLFWAAMGVGFALCASSIVPVQNRDIPALSSIYALSYIGGLLALFSPAGLGVREGISAYLLGPYFVHPLPSVISVFARLWATAFEVLLFLMLLYFPTAPRRAEPQEEENTEIPSSD